MSFGYFDIITPLQQLTELSEIFCNYEEHAVDHFLEKMALLNLYVCLELKSRLKHVIIANHLKPSTKFLIIYRI